jgi:hypothetical protein
LATRWRGGGEEGVDRDEEVMERMVDVKRVRSSEEVVR